MIKEIAKNYSKQISPVDINGETAYVGKVSAAIRQKVVQLQVKDDDGRVVDTQDAFAFLLAHAIKDELGNREFSDAECEAINELPSEIYIKLLDATMRFNKWGSETDEAETLKNSETSQN